MTWHLGLQSSSFGILVHFYVYCGNYCIRREVLCDQHKLITLGAGVCVRCDLLFYRRCQAALDQRATPTVYTAVTCTLMTSSAVAGSCRVIAISAFRQLSDSIVQLPWTCPTNSTVQWWSMAGHRPRVRWQDAELWLGIRWLADKRWSTPEKALNHLLKVTLNLQFSILCLQRFL